MKLSYFSATTSRNARSRLAQALALACTGLAISRIHAQFEPRTVFVTPNGNDVLCTEEQPCSLPEAVKLANGRVVEQPQSQIIKLAAGRYRLQEPIVLTPSASGSMAGALEWQGPENGDAILDGGLRIRGWKLFDRRRNLWRAQLPAGANSLQLFVNGVRAVRARHQGCASPSICQYTPNGLADGARQLPPLAHPEDVVAVVAVRWRDFHCGVASVNGPDLLMSQPCWHNTTIDSAKNGWSNASPKGKPFKGIDWFENAFEFLGTPGQFYIDPRRHFIFYTPRRGEDLLNADVEMPMLEHLLLLEGTYTSHIHDISFRRITFQHSSWSYSASGDGYVPLQAGYLVTGTRNNLPNNGEGMWRIPAAVQVSGGEHIHFVDNRFSALGTSGISFDSGTRGSSIEQSTFDDLSGGAIFVGDIVAKPRDPAARSGGNLISHNTITRIAVEYRDNVAIMGAFNDGLTIDHNTIRDIPYTGISVGWGWNYEGSGDTQRDIHIRSNRISQFMLVLRDGGAIYTQAQSPGSDVLENYIDFREGAEGNGIYLDERSRGYNVCGNVVWNVPQYMKEGQWVSAWASWSGDLTIHNNWSDDPHTTLHNPGSTKSFYSNQLALKVLPPQAETVVDSAGATGPEHLVTNCLTPPGDPRTQDHVQGNSR